MKILEIPFDWKQKKDTIVMRVTYVSDKANYMETNAKSKTILKQIELLEKTPISYERNVLISELKNKLEQTSKTYFKFNYVKHHMNIDIYEIIWKDLYWHFKRLLDTMNENNVCDLDTLDVKKSAKYNIKSKLIDYWLIKDIKKKGNVNKKLYINPLFWLRNRANVDIELKKEFSEVNEKIFNIKL